MLGKDVFQPLDKKLIQTSNREKITNLVFQGGSIKGIAYVGAIKTLEESGFIDFTQLERIAGTSAGSITAMLRCIGYDGKKMQKIMSKMDFTKFLDEMHGNVRDSLLKGKKKKKSFQLGVFFASKVSDSTASHISSRLSKHNGLFMGEYFRAWAEKYMRKATNIPHLTFAELHNLKLQNPEKYKDLYVVGTNITTGFAETFSHETTPDVIISDAVRISMSIPIIFEPHQVYIKDASGDRIPDPTKKEFLYVDGGLIENYPLSIFDDKRYFSPDIQSTFSVEEIARGANPATLGFRLVDKTKKAFLEGKTTQASTTTEITGFISYTWSILNAIYHKQESDHIRNAESSRTIYIDTCGVNMLDFDLDIEKQDLLLNSGRSAVEEFLELNQIRASIQLS